MEEFKDIYPWGRVRIDIDKTQICFEKAAKSDDANMSRSLKTRWQDHWQQPATLVENQV